MRIIRVDVDTQVDFALETGSLHVPTDPSVLENVSALLRDARDNGIPIIGSVDSHSYDAWEFSANGGPFPAHCVKGTPGWLKLEWTLPERYRFIPMTHAVGLIGPNSPDTGNRPFTGDDFAVEAMRGVAMYFEKEVYSAFANPCAEMHIEALVERMGRDLDMVTFQVFGYCTGGFCVDAFALELAKRGYRVQVVLDATAPIDGVNGPDGLEYSRETLTAAGIECITTEDALAFAQAC